MLEAVPEETQLQERYRAFLEDEIELTGDEREQLGFQLARQFDHPRVYQADHQLGMDLGAVLSAARRGLNVSPSKNPLRTIPSRRPPFRGCLGGAR